MKNYILISFILIFFGCNFKNKNEDVTGSLPRNIKTLEKSSKIISLAIDDETSNISTGFSYYDSDSIWFFNLNGNKNEIQMFNLNSNFLHDRFVFDKEGDNGVGNIFGFYIHNLDSIFLFPHNLGQIILTDTSKAINSKIKYEVPPRHTAAFVLSSYFYSPPKYIDGKLIVKSHVQGDHRKLSDKDLSSNSLAYSIDLQSGNVNLLPHFYPEGYLSDGPKHFEQSIAVSDSKIVYSLFADHNLYYADSENSKLKKKGARSRFLTDEFENYPSSGNRLESYKYLSVSQHYESLIYDRYRKVFYRFCYPKVDLEDETDIMKSRLFPSLFSIMILDDNLNIVGETLFNDEKLLANNAFVAKEGLYISLNHTDNSKNNEDYLTFQLFELSDVTNEN